LIALDGRLSKVFVGGFVLVGKHGDFGRHAMFQGVEFRFCFSLFGFGAGRLLRVPAICFDLLLRSHPNFRVQSGFGENGWVKMQMVEKQANRDFFGWAPRLRTVRYF
jgi:hypothetical protein